MRLLAHTHVALSLALAVAAPNQLELHHVDPSGAEVAVASAKPDILSLDDATALIIVDVQTCFISAGASGANPDLPVTNGGDVAAGIADLARLVTAAGGIVAASQDWHTPAHHSFKAQGGPWPVHCVQGSATAALDPKIAGVVTAGWTFRKAFITSKDSYSAFGGYDNVKDDTTKWTEESEGGNSLNKRLQERTVGVGKAAKPKPITKLLVTGIASEYCVKATAMDGLQNKYEVYYLTDLGRGVAADTTLTALRDLSGKGAKMHVVSTVSTLPVIAP